MLISDERQKLVKIIADLSAFTDGDVRARRILLEMAGLKRFRKMGLDGLPDTVAGLVVVKLEDFGYLPERPAYHALGALLSYVLTLEELAPHNAPFLAHLIVHYPLVRHLTYVDELRTQY